jgi:hypothetical protein
LIEYHKKGLTQLNNYLDIQGLDKGYLVVYNFNKDKEYKEESINYEGKQIFIVYLQEYYKSLKYTPKVVYCGKKIVK